MNFVKVSTALKSNLSHMVFGEKMFLPSLKEEVYVYILLFRTILK